MISTRMMPLVTSMAYRRAIEARDAGVEAMFRV